MCSIANMVNLEATVIIWLAMNKRKELFISLITWKPNI